MSKKGRPTGPSRLEDCVHVGRFIINEEKFFSRIIEGENGCMTWIGGKHRQGYGMFNLYNTTAGKKQMQVAHRIAMMIELGRELGRYEFVIHNCDNPLCCNPDHMFVGTPEDRNRVAREKGHIQTKWKTGNAVKKQKRNYKYPEDMMRFIRDNPTEVSAAKYGIDKGKIWYMKDRFKKGYKWL